MIPTLLQTDLSHVPTWALGVAVIITAIGAKLLPWIGEQIKAYRESEAEEEKRVDASARSLIKGLEQSLEHERERRHQAEERVSSLSIEVAEQARTIARLEGKLEAEQALRSALETRVQGLEEALKSAFTRPVTESQG